METDQVGEVKLRDTALRFHISNPRDHIQRRHLSGHLYELEELLLIEKNFPAGAFFVISDQTSETIPFSLGNF
ncbi:MULTISPECIES: hypothetical protein [unclassified Ruegeria]|uniref:hypothetical protein n=1 Tax=unclassified Ruegeria TaxID=2625375 RepID=UPI0014912FC5|nr:MULTISPECIES: hypothetical protein [unclassified Ruegeria]NOD33784.1 hypothetical protein [Ruegeria sp. HKCCD7296]NOD45917.1 hypothetical protein [Ruegeria sp. HKCCD5849]NOD50783.1 hypothetical protein [Ruegeria sp. HKCCD5851]NOD67599.1 hypothetical protein [Ruegeria sp. HKCCD7303]NOE40541.1 hypothetical protein [Ruegeria sp. HKCCD7319]